MSGQKPPQGFVPAPSPAGGHTQYFGPSSGVVTTSWDDGQTLVHIDVEDSLTVDAARQLAADLAAVVTRLDDED